MKESHKRSRNPKYKTEYRVKNCSQYEQSLRDRGNLTLWFSPKSIKLWNSKPSGKQGRYKTTIGRKLRARIEESREVEAKIGCQILNRFIELGKATSERVA